MVGGCHGVPSPHFSGFLCCYTSGAFWDLKKISAAEKDVPGEPCNLENFAF